MSPAGRHVAGGVRGTDEGGADAGVDHRGPAVGGFMPEGQMKGEDAILEYGLVAAPCGVDEEIDITGAFEGGGGLGIVRVVARDADDVGGQVGGCDRAASGEDAGAPFGRENRGDSATDSTACSCDKSIHEMACPRRKTSRKASRMGPTLAIPFPAISKAVPCAGVAMGFGRPPWSVTPFSKPMSFMAIWP